MMPPDPASPEGRAVLRRELAAVARPLRFVGVAFAMLGVALAVVRAVALPAMPALVPLAALAVGLLNLLAARALRSRYHRARIGEK